MKRKSDVHVTAVEDGGSEDEDLFEIEALSSTSKWPIRPIGIKMAKEHQRLRKATEDLVRAQAKATAAMAAANLRKAQALSDQAALSLFTMPANLNLSEQAREYLELRREEEMRKLRRRIAAEKEQEAREAAEWKRQVQENAAEVSNRVLPRYINPPPRSSIPCFCNYCSNSNLLITPDMPPSPISPSLTSPFRAPVNST
jgi:hypothetical protein